MDNKQAKECLKSIDILKYRDDDKNYFFDDVKGALDIAIKSLEAWDKVIEELEKEFKEYDNALTDLDYSTGLGYALAVIDEHLGGKN